MAEQFIRERLYLKGVSLKTVAGHKDSFNAFPALNCPAIIDRIAELWCPSAPSYGARTLALCGSVRSLGKRVEIPKRKEEQKVLATLTQPPRSSLLKFVPTHPIVEHSGCKARLNPDSRSGLQDFLTQVFLDCWNPDYWGQFPDRDYLADFPVVV